MFSFMGLHNKKGRRRWAVPLAAIAASAVVSSSPPAFSADTTVAADAYCPQQHVSKGLIYCTQLFAGAPAIHLPANPSATQVYGALLTPDGTEGDFFIDQTGKRYFISEAVNPTFDTNGPQHEWWASRIYLATVADGKVTSLKPVMVVTNAAILTRYWAGKTIEGMIDQYANGAYGPKKARIRVQLDKAASPTNGNLYGKIVNAFEATRSADGSCIPALGSLGKADPLKPNEVVGGFTPSDNINMYRIDSMHDPGDPHVGFEQDSQSGSQGAITTMGGLFISAADLMSHLAPTLPETTTAGADFGPHGNYPGLSSFRFVNGGGQPCSTSPTTRTTPPASQIKTPAGLPATGR